MATPRGSYAKGRAKREEILDTAFELIAREGYSGTTLKQIADAVGLSQAGVLHHFGGKDRLLTEVMRRRDSRDNADFGFARGTRGELFAELRRLVAHNAAVPGLVQLFERLASDASDPGHAAHDYFRERYASVTGAFAEAIRASQADGMLAADLDPERTAVLVVAAIDGLQRHWLYDPTIDMAAELGYLEGLLRGSRRIVL